MLKDKIKKIDFKIIGAALMGIGILVLIVLLTLLFTNVVKEKETINIFKAVIVVLVFGGFLLALFTPEPEH